MVAPESTEPAHTKHSPLIVDLDRTVLRTDVGIEALIGMLFKRPWLVFALPFWMFSGLAHAKRKILAHVTINFESLPENGEVLDFIRSEVKRGRQALLVTASDQMIADRCAQRFGCFSEAVGSDGITNLKGPNKARYLTSRFGARGFCYVGDSSADLAVWREAGSAVVVDYLDGRRTQQAARVCPVERSFLISCCGGVAEWIRELRVYQWAKNALLVLPLILAHELHDTDKVLAVLIGFFAFSLTASSVYILNDIGDLEADRSHPHKRLRPLASGELRLEVVAVSAALLLVSAAALTGILIPELSAVLLLYFGLTCVYTWWGKEQLGLDIMMLAALYCVRIVAGGVVADVRLSTWLLMFGGFIFVSLACVKRTSELASQLRAASGAEMKQNRRAYSPSDLPVLTAVGVCSGLLSVLVCALYFSSAEVTALYNNPTLLFFGILPIMTLWVVRVWLLAARGSAELEDPVLFAMTDRASLACGALLAVFVWFAV